MVAPNASVFRKPSATQLLAHQRIECGRHGHWIHIIESLSESERSSQLLLQNDLITHAQCITPPYYVILSFHQVPKPVPSDFDDAIAIAHHFVRQGGIVIFTGLESLGTWDDYFLNVESIDTAIEHMNRLL